MTYTKADVQDGEAAQAGQETALSSNAQEALDLISCYISEMFSGRDRDEDSDCIAYG